MALRFRVLDEAKLELAEAAAHYDLERDGLGRELLVAYRTVIVHVLDHPEAGSLIKHAASRYPMRRVLFEPRFPYAVVVALVEDEVVVVAVAHQHRAPFYWRKRVARVKTDQPG